MNHYLVFLPNGETIPICEDDFHWKDIGVLTFKMDGRNVVVFNTNNICGVIEYEEGDAE